MKAVAIGKLTPGQQYFVDGVPATFLGTRFSSVVGKSTKMDTFIAKFGRAMFGDRWIFVDSKGAEMEFKKGYNAAKKPGLVPADGELMVEKTAKIVA